MREESIPIILYVTKVTRQSVLVTIETVVQVASTINCGCSLTYAVKYFVEASSIHTAILDKLIECFGKHTKSFKFDIFSHSEIWIILRIQDSSDKRFTKQTDKKSK